MVARPLALIRLAHICLLVSLLGACAYSQPPNVRDGLVTPYSISGVSPNTKVGNLMLDESGLWGFVHSRSSEAPPQFKKGELVAFLSEGSSSPAHLFGVVAARSWGVMLQRLDDSRVRPDELKGELVALSRDTQVESWGLCRGGADVLAEDSCLANPDSVTTWRVFEFDADMRLRVADAPGLAMPVRTAGLVHGERAVVQQGALDKGWIAIPARQDGPHVLHARALLGPECSEVDLSQSIQPLEVLATKEKASEGGLGDGHPVDVEARAAARGVDVLVECTAASATIFTPTIYRPLLSFDSKSAHVVPFGAMRPMVVSRDDVRDHDEVVASLTLLGAALATGSTLAADFYLEQALVAAGDTKVGEQLATEFMQVPSAAGRPEAAVHAGREATKDAWQRENLPGYVIGKAAALAALGQNRAHGEAMARVAMLAEASDHERVRLWMVWSRLRDGLRTTSRKAAEAAISHFDDAGLARWLEATQLLVDWNASGTRGHGDSASGLHRVFEASPNECPDASTCQLDIYGRNFASLVNILGPKGSDRLLEQVNTVGLAALRPGFVHTTLDAADLAPNSAVALRATMMPLLTPAARADGLAVLIDEVARAWRAEGTCVEIDGRQSIARRVGRLAHRQAPDPTLAATHWLLVSALPAACDSLEQFLMSLEAGIDSYPTLATHAGELVEALSVGASDEERVEILRRFADFSAEHERGEACKRWNLALAVSSATSARLDEAEVNLARAINCEVHGERAYASTEALLIGYLQFEKSASIPDGLPGDVRELLAALLRRQPRKGEEAGACIGLTSLDYKLEQFVHPDVAALAVAMPSPPREGLALETSSHTTARGIASLRVARRLLAEARPQEAARALIEARRAFERVGHTVGLRRAAFLEAVVFEEELEAVVAREDAPESTQVSLDQPRALSAAQWARALRAGQARAVLEAAKRRVVDSKEALEAQLAASLIVDSEEHSITLWRSGSGRTPFDVLCTVNE